MTIEEITRGQERLKAIDECHNLVMNMSYLLASNLTREFVAEWANRDDDMLVMPWGCYDGIAGVTRCFTVDHKDINDEGAFEALKGSLNCDSITAPIIEIADDGETARGVFVTHRMETTPYHNEIEDRSYQCMWQWGWYGVDFVKEDGAWKIWHLRIYPCFKVDFGQDWAKQEYSGFDLRVPTPDRPAPENYKYNTEEMFPENYPPIPEAYATFGDVAPGYAFNG